MKAKFGAIVVDGRNKVGGHVLSKNRHGAYVRTKVTPVNPKSSFQTVVRAQMTSLAQGWRALSQTQRNEWNGAVENFKKTDIFGDLKTPSGFNLYMRLNKNILTTGGTIISVPPLPTSVDSFSAVALTYTSGTPALSLAFTATSGTSHGYVVLATPPLSAGKNFVKSELRVITKGTALATSPLDILSAYTAKYGAVGAVGTKIFVQIKAVGSTTGIAGQSVIANAIAAS